MELDTIICGDALHVMYDRWLLRILCPIQARTAVIIAVSFLPLIIGVPLAPQKVEVGGVRAGKIERNGVKCHGCIYRRA